MIMLDYKRILVPYDGSEYAKRALDRAVSVARCCDGAKLFIATVSRPMPPMEKIAREQANVFNADKTELAKKDAGQVLFDDLKLRPGMFAKADIVTVRKTPGRLFWMIQKNSFPRIFLMN